MFKKSSELIATIIVFLAGGAAGLLAAAADRPAAISKRVGPKGVLLKAFVRPRRPVAQIAPI
jgi:hypothetical protein